MLVATAAGSVGLPLRQVAAALLGRPVPAAVRDIVVAIRLPRVIMAALVGAGLGISGAVMQGVFRNPLADPGLLGISAGAGFAAVLGIALRAGGGLWSLQGFTFVGALCGAGAVYGLAVRHGRTPVLALVLAGVAVSALFAAGTTLLLTLGPFASDVPAMLQWLYGSLNGALWRQDAVLLPFVAAGAAAMLALARELNLLATEEEGAAALGVPAETVRRLLLALVALVTGAAVAAAGPIAFVGLMVPHILRLLVGADHRRLLPASLLGGASFLVGADLLARTVAAPAEISLGVVTALAGAPFFLYLLRRAVDQP
jgi:iron complex transport system permease protein